MSGFGHLRWQVALGLLVAVALTSPAGATTKGECAVIGNVKAMSKQDPIAKLWFPLVGESRKYEFVGTLECVVLAKGTPEVVSLDVESTGWYDNVVCGTGKAYSEGTEVVDQRGGTKDYAAILTDMRHKFVFVASVGQFYWAEWNKPKLEPNAKVDDVADPNDDKEPQDADWQLAGSVQALLDAGDEEKPFEAPDPIANQCVRSIKVIGAIHLDPRIE